MSNKGVIGLGILVMGMGAVGGGGATAWALHLISLGIITGMVLGVVAAVVGGYLVVRR